MKSKYICIYIFLYIFLYIHIIYIHMYIFRAGRAGCGMAMLSALRRLGEAVGLGCKKGGGVEGGGGGLV